MSFEAMVQAVQDRVWDWQNEGVAVNHDTFVDAANELGLDHVALEAWGRWVAENLAERA